MRRRVDAPERRRLRDKTGGGLGLLAPLENLPKSAAVGEYAGRRLGDVRDVGQARGGEVHDGPGELLEGGGGEARVQTSLTVSEAGSGSTAGQICLAGFGKH